MRASQCVEDEQLSHQLPRDAMPEGVQRTGFNARVAHADVQFHAPGPTPSLSLAKGLSQHRSRAACAEVATG